MRERYEELELEIIEFDTEDVITNLSERYRGPVFELDENE